MKKLVPSLNGHPLRNDDSVFIQDVTHEYLQSIFKDLESTTGWVIISGVVFSTDVNGDMLWTDGYVWNTTTKKLYYVTANTTPVSGHINFLNFVSHDDQDMSVTGANVLNEDGVVTNVWKWDYVDLVVGSSTAEYQNTPRLHAALGEMYANETQTDWQSATINSTGGWTGSIEFRRTSSGVVEFRGELENPSVANVTDAIMFTLPQGFIPNTTTGITNYYLGLDVSAGAVQIEIPYTGEVIIDYTNTSSVARLRLDPVRFKAE